MRTRRMRLGAGGGSRLLVLMLLMAVIAGWQVPVVAQETADDEGVTTITGALTITNPIILANASQAQVLLMDMTPYVQRDWDLPPSLASQVIAPFEGDLATEATFSLKLPIAPQGTINDLDGGEGEGAGVQLYSVEFYPNSYGDAFLGPFEGGGWGTALSSLVTTVGASEVVGGAVAVWAPDENQLFPTDLGPDGRFLTDDDPVGPIPAGWTVVDLNEQPFRQIRDAEAEVEIVEGDDGFTDYGQLSFTEAFDNLVDELELRYPFTELKGINWETMRAEYRPRIEEAEANDDVLAFNIAMIDFATAFGDGHVSAGFPPEFIAQNIGGRLGMRVAETESGDVIAVSITEGLPADQAGIELGAVITSWDGQPVADAVAAEPLLFGVSTEFSRELQQYEFLTRGPLGETVSVGFRNGDGAEQTADLTFSEDIEGRDVAANEAVSQGDFDPTSLPIDATLMDSGIGLIRVNSFFADPVMQSTAWNYALTNFQSYGATGLILDLRDNGGGFGDTALFMAGSFTDEEYELYRTELIDETGASIDQGADEVVPNPVQWDLPVAVLIDDGCASACEIFAAAMATNPDNLIVGYTPTAGVEAGVYFWNLPGDVSFQSSVARLVSGGEVFLEGTGVPPNVEVPATAENLLNPEDEVMAAAEEALTPLIEAAQAAAEGEASAEEPAASPEATPDATPEVPDSPAPPIDDATPEV